MYVKLYNRILDSSLAENRPLRHFFTDLLLCADLDGTVIMTKEAIRKRIGATLEEVEWGLEELQKPDTTSLSPDHDGRRVIPLEGHGYGWKIVNFEEYRDLKSAAHMREKTAERVKRYRERKAKKPKATAGAANGALEREFIRAESEGDTAAADAAVNASLPEPKQPVDDTPF